MSAQGSAAHSSIPRVSLGLLAYEPDRGLFSAALRCVNDQTFEDFELIVLDDASAGVSVAEIVQSVCGDDPRVRVVVNPRRLGMSASAQKVLDAANSQSDYFAWLSDHDGRAPDWLESLVRVLDEDDGAVLAYPWATRSTGDSLRDWHLSLSGCADSPGQRFRSFLELPSGAGYLIYGLFRRGIIEQIGGWPHLYLPDQMVVLRALGRGHLAPVERALYHRVDQPSRRANKAGWRRRQARGIFVDGFFIARFTPIAVAQVMHLIRVEVLAPTAQMRTGVRMIGEVIRISLIRFPGNARLTVQRWRKRLRRGRNRLGRVSARIRRRVVDSRESGSPAR